MPCTTILVGKKASYDGSTMIARNDDSGAGHYTSKKFVVIHPEEQPRTYKTEISHLTIELPDNPMRYTAVPNAEKGEGVWSASGVNAAQVGMTATETITSNPRVLGADPFISRRKTEKKRFRAESARRTSFILFFLILKAPEKVSKDLAACWSSTVHTR